MKSTFALAHPLQEERVRLELLVLLNEFARLGARGLDKLEILEGLHADIGDSPLLSPIELARSPLHKIHLCEFESVFRGFKRLEPRERPLTPSFDERETIRLMGTPHDS